MLPRRKRISKRDFPTVARFPLVVRGPFGSLRGMGGAARAAVVVSKKIAPNAVERNSLRRRCYAALRAPLAAYPVSVILYPTLRAKDAPYTELALALNDMVREIWSKSKVC